MRQKEKFLVLCEPIQYLISSVRMSYADYPRKDSIETESAIREND